MILKTLQTFLSEASNDQTGENILSDSGIGEPAAGTDGEQENRAASTEDESSQDSQMTTPQVPVRLFCRLLIEVW